MHTKLPAGLDEADFGVMYQEWDGTPQEVGFRLKIRIENHNIIAVLDISMLHPLFQSPSFVPISVVTYLVLYIDPLARPPVTFELYQVLHCAIHTQFLTCHNFMYITCHNPPIESMIHVYNLS